jgi:hypothetical protein
MSKTLANEKYAGTFVYGVSKWPLSGGRTLVPKSEWVRVKGAIRPIVSDQVFAAAQRRRIENEPLTKNDLLNYLTAVWCTAGALSIPIVNRDMFAPSAPTYRDHFGHITEAYRLIGYKRVHSYRYSKISGEMRRVHREILCQLTAAPRGCVTYEELSDTVTFDGKIQVAVVVLPFLNRRYMTNRGWKLYLCRLPPCHSIFVARMNEKNSEVYSYHLIPRSVFEKPSFVFTKARMPMFARYKVPSTSGFVDALTALLKSSDAHFGGAPPAQ